MEWNSYEEVNFEYLANFDFVNYHEQIHIHEIKCKSEHRAQSTKQKRSGSI